MIKQCTACGAQNSIRDEWQVGNPECEHFYRVIVSGSLLEEEVRKLLIRYTPSQIQRALDQLCS